MNNHQAQRERILARAVENDTPLATYPLPIGDVQNTLHVLVGLFPLETLIQLSEGLARCVEVIRGCATVEPSSPSTSRSSGISRTRTSAKTHPTPAQSVPTSGASSPIHHSRLTAEERSDILARRARGERLAVIVQAVGRSMATVQSVIAKAKRDAEGGGA